MVQTGIQSAFERAFGSGGQSPARNNAPGVQGRIEDAEKVDWEKRVEEEFDLQMHKAKIMVVGCGGAGCNRNGRNRR